MNQNAGASVPVPFKRGRVMIAIVIVISLAIPSGLWLLVHNNRSRLHSDDEAKMINEKAMKLYKRGYYRRREEIFDELGIDPSRLAGPQHGGFMLARSETWQLSPSYLMILESTAQSPDEFEFPAVVPGSLTRNESFWTKVQRWFQ
jgi:hypothetical protein